jgi:hypothetical protein
LPGSAPSQLAAIVFVTTANAPTAILEFETQQTLEGDSMGSKGATKFTSRGRLAGLVRDEAPVGTGPNRANRSRRDPGQSAAEEALYYRARLILGDSLTRPSR